MREILFRGKPISTEEELKIIGAEVKEGWVYGVPIEDFIVEGCAEVTEDFFAPEQWVRVNPSTVGQFTGLLDKNGKRIFEGDVVLWREEETAKVVFKDSEFCLDFKDEEQLQHGLLCDDCGYKFELLEVPHDQD